jgi:organic radical activating enzyme|tara:strand:- start:1701 stop:3134 length:1434 start_codon:yes stop_codon:yes gene_type:complete
MAEEKDELKKQISEDNPFYVKVNEELNSTGCGMCLAKWTQVTMHLQLGHTHSCHHPKTHPIPEREIRRNPSALHNTRYKKQKRREMLEGKRPEECNYCWNIEDSSDRFSDRTFKSAESWSYPHMDEIKQSHWRDDFNPRYVEVAFSNACNFKCSYCAPAFSTQWMEEIKKHGAYPTTDKFNDLEYNKQENKMPIPQSEENPYVEAFWKWWPDLYNDLHTFRITGGEPLMSKDTWKVLDYIIDHPNPNKNLSIAINSNLGIPDKLLDRFIEKIQRICEGDKVKEFIVFTSVDTWGEQAEYIRNGLEFNKFWDNVNKVLQKCPRVNLTFMSTYNGLSIPGYHKLINGIYQLKEEYGSTDRYWNSAAFLDSSYLRFPTHQTVQVMPKEWASKIYEDAQLADFLSVPLFDHKYVGYSDIEIQKIKRIYDWMLSPVDEQRLKTQRRNFGHYFREHDKRRGTDFCKVFPEFEEFYHECLNIRL